MAVTRPSPLVRDGAAVEAEPEPEAPASSVDDEPPLAQTRLALIVLLLAVTVPIVVMAVNAARQPWLASSDEALILIRALDVPRHLPLTGTYSRYGFDHPGPLLFYALALPVHLFGSPGLLLGSGAVSAASAGGSCYVAWRRGGVVLATATAVALLLFVHAMGEAVVSAWNPWAAVLPYFLSVLLAWGVSQRDWRLLPWLMLSTSYAAQAHVSYAPFAALLVLGALGWALVARWKGRRRKDSASVSASSSVSASPDERARPTRPSGRLLLLTGAVLAVLWLPPLVQQVRADDGNLTKLARHFLADHSGETSASVWTQLSLPEPDLVLGITARELGALPPWIGAPEDGDPFTGNVVGASGWLLPAPYLVAAVVLALAIRRRLRDAIAFQVIALGLVALSIGAMSRAMGGLAPYIVRFTWIPAAMVALSTAWSASRLLGAPAPATGEVVRTRSSSTMATTAASPAMVGALGAVGVLAVVVGLLATHEPLRDAVPSDVAVHVVDATEDALPPGRQVRVVGVGDDGIAASGAVEAELLRRGIPIVVAPADEWRYDAAHWTTDPDPVIVTVKGGPNGGSFAPSPDDRLVASYDALSPDERRDFDRLRPLVVANFLALSKGEPMPDAMTDDEEDRYRDLVVRSPEIQVYVDPGG